MLYVVPTLFGCFLEVHVHVVACFHLKLALLILFVSLRQQPSTIVSPYDRSPQNGAYPSTWVYRLERRK